MNRIFLNVGGHTYETTASTLARVEYFDSLVQWNQQVTQPIFIDRDGRFFAYILNFLRGSQVLPNDEETLNHLLVEADFYGMTELVNNIREHKNKIFTRDRFQRELLSAIRQSFSH